MTAGFWLDFPGNLWKTISVLKNWRHPFNQNDSKIVLINPCLNVILEDDINKIKYNHFPRTFHQKHYHTVAHVKSNNELDSKISTETEPQSLRFRANWSILDNNELSSDLQHKNRLKKITIYLIQFQKCNSLISQNNWKIIFVVKFTKLNSTLNILSFSCNSKYKSIFFHAPLDQFFRHSTCLR